MWNDIGAEVEVDQGDEGCRNQVRLEQLLEADASCQHGYNLRVACQLRRKEDDGDKYKKGREEVGKIGHEVGVIVKDDGLPGSPISREFRQVLIEVEDDGDRDDQQDRENIGTDEFGHQISIQASENAKHLDLWETDLRKPLP